MTAPDPILTPRLVIDGAARAIDFYEKVLGATCLERYATEDGRVVHAALSIRGAVIALTDEDGTHNVGPKHPGASPVLLHLMVDDPDATAAAMVAGGGTVLIPIGNQFYGYREGRVADPFGHAWILSRCLEKLEREEIERRVRQHEG